jgi:DNA-binding IclR family transcriptional regulator
LVDLDALAIELRAIRRAGVAFDHEEIVPGLSCVAAPVRDETGEPVAGISLSVPTYRFVGAEDAYVRLIANTAYRISCRLGYTGPPPDASELDRAVTSQPGAIMARP